MLNFETLDLHPSRAVVAQSDLAPNLGGVYALFFDCKELVLEKSGYLEFDTAMPVTVDGYDLLYVGASIDPLRRRVLAHLTGNSKASSLRQTVGAVMAPDLNLDPVGDERRHYFHFGTGEHRLTDWMVENTKVAFCPDPDPFGLERRILHQIAVPLNISERKRHPYSRYLMALRSYYAARPRLADTVEPIERKAPQKPLARTEICAA